mgnify:CR=1 FL=1
MPYDRLMVFTGNATPKLAADVVQHLNISLGKAKVGRFSDGEVNIELMENVRGRDVFLVQPTCPPAADNLLELLVMADACRRASAARITAVIPYFGYARQDRKAEGREPITARLVADLFKSAGAQRMVSLDLHSGQIQGFFNGPVDHLTAMPVLETYVRKHAPSDLVIVSPDAGRVKVAERFAQYLADKNADVAFINKRRPKGTTNVAIAKEVIGEVEGRLCILTDDMIDTGGTIVSAAELLLERGAKEVWAMATHGVLSGPAVDRLQNSPLDRVVLTNTLPLPEEKKFPKVEVLSVARIIGDALAAVFDETSVSELFDGENQS